MSICGLDFGTSNTTLGTIEGQAPVLVALEAAQTTIPSAMFYETDGGVLIGRRAVEAYVEGAPGRLMRSLKSVLGTSLIDETTRLGRERVSFRDVIAYYLGAVKRRAEQATGHELRQCRPRPAGSLRRQCAGRRSQGGGDPADHCAGDRL